MSTAAPALKITVADITLGADAAGTRIILEGGREVEIVPLSGGTFRLFLEDRVLTGYVVEHDYAAKTLTLSAGGHTFECKVQTRLDQVLAKFGIATGASTKVGDLKAPMPGLVQRILVTPGQAVEKGTPLLVLVAMKMENMIKAPAAGTVSKIAVAEGDKVEKGHVMLSF